jgi:hypothetical protein
MTAWQHTTIKSETGGIMRNKGKALAFALVLLVLAAGGAALAASNSNNPPSYSQYEQGQRAQLATSVDATQASAFGVLRRNRTITDDLPARLIAALTRQGHFTGIFGANVDLARRIAGPSGNAWIVPGKGAICFYATSNLNPSVSQPGAPSGGLCVSDADAAQGHALIEAGSVKMPGQDFVAGVVPDGVSSVALHLSDGTTKPVTVSENAYIAEVAGHVSSIGFSGPKGAVTRAP